jgi:hypothetical protein
MGHCAAGLDQRRTSAASMRRARYPENGLDRLGEGGDVNLFVAEWARAVDGRREAPRGLRDDGRSSSVNPRN